MQYDLLYSFSCKDINSKKLRSLPNFLQITGIFRNFSQFSIGRYFIVFARVECHQEAKEAFVKCHNWKLAISEAIQLHCSKDDLVIFAKTLSGMKGHFSIIDVNSYNFFPSNVP